MITLRVEVASIVLWGTDRLRVLTLRQLRRSFQKLMVHECYLQQQIFMLFYYYITAEENAMPGHKLMKDCLTLLFYANASSDFKVEPLLVYHSENP